MWLRALAHCGRSGDQCAVVRNGDAAAAYGDTCTADVHGNARAADRDPGAPDGHSHACAADVDAAASHKYPDPDSSSQR
jgi:hypothetical protein